MKTIFKRGNYSLMRDKVTVQLDKMKSFFAEDSKIEVVLLFCICLFISFSFGSRYLNEDNYNYGVEEMHAYDSNLFSSNINVIGAEYSPRFYANQIMSLLIHVLGSSWYDAAAILIRFNYVLYALAATMITLRLCRKHCLLCGALVSTCLMAGSLISLAFEINGATDVFIGTSVPIALIGLSFLLGDNSMWLPAWIFIAIAGFFHVHEGMWAGCVVVFFWLGSCIEKKCINLKSLWGMIVYVISMTIIIAPSLLNTSSVDEETFVDLYVFIRTPHHLLLSAWGWKKIIASGFLLLLSALAYFLLCKKYFQPGIKKYIAGIIPLAVLWVGLLGVEYVFTEVHPSSFVATMYLTKCFKYITILMAFLLIKTGFLLMENKRYLSAVLILMIPIVPSSSYFLYVQLLLFAMFFIAEFIDIESVIFDRINIDKHVELFEMTITMLLLIVVYSRLLLSGVSSLSIFPYLLFVIILFKFLPRNAIRYMLDKVVSIIIALILVILTADGFIFDIEMTGISYIGGEEFTKNGMSSSIYALATEFRGKVEGETLFLADPDSTTSNAFQLVSQKSCYALYKNTPSDKNTILEWYDRIENVRKITSCSVDELNDLMDEIDIKYVLVTADRFDELEESNLFETVCKNEEYAVYSKK